MSTAPTLSLMTTAPGTYTPGHWLRALGRIILLDIV
jgi:hypothetical protein